MYTCHARRAERILYILHRFMRRQTALYAVNLPHRCMRRQTALYAVNLPHRRDTVLSSHARAETSTNRSPREACVSKIRDDGIFRRSLNACSSICSRSRTPTQVLVMYSPAGAMPWRASSTETMQTTLLTCLKHFFTACFLPSTRSVAKHQDAMHSSDCTSNQTPPAANIFFRRCFL